MKCHRNDTLEILGKHAHTRLNFKSFPEFLFAKWILNDPDYITGSRLMLADKSFSFSQTLVEFGYLLEEMGLISHGFLTDPKKASARLVYFALSVRCKLFWRFLCSPPIQVLWSVRPGYHHHQHGWGLAWPVLLHQVLSNTAVENVSKVSLPYNAVTSD